VGRLGQWEVAGDDPREARPTHPVTLTSATKLGKPERLHFVEELRHPFQVAGDGLIVQPTLTNPSQPFTDRINRPMALLDRLHLDHRNRGTQTLRDRCPAEGEPASTGHIAAMREAKKIERFRSTFTARLPIAGRIAAKFDQASFIFVKLQPELRRAVSEIFQTPLGISLAFEANHKVIRIPNHDDIAVGSVLTP